MPRMLIYVLNVYIVYIWLAIHMLMVAFVMWFGFMRENKVISKVVYISRFIKMIECYVLKNMEMRH